MQLTRRDFIKMGCVSVGALAGISLFGCSPQQNASNSGNTTNEQGENMATNETSGSPAKTTAVIYFSCTGTTKKIAEMIASATDGELMQIKPAEPYTSADLDYESDCRANAEQNSSTARPAIAAPVPNIEGCNTVYLGFPIWWGKAPRIILTFLEGADTAGKTIIPFCTSGSSPISGSISEIKQAAPGATVLEGKRFPASTSQQEIDSWVNGL